VEGARRYFRQGTCGRRRLLHTSVAVGRPTAPSDVGSEVLLGEPYGEEMCPGTAASSLAPRETADTGQGSERMRQNTARRCSACHVVNGRHSEHLAHSSNKMTHD